MTSKASTRALSPRQFGFNSCIRRIDTRAPIVCSLITAPRRNNRHQQLGTRSRASIVWSHRNFERKQAKNVPQGNGLCPLWIDAFGDKHPISRRLAKQLGESIYDDKLFLISLHELMLYFRLVDEQGSSEFLLHRRHLNLDVKTSTG